MENLDPYLERFSKSGKRILETALDETHRREQYCISPEHILYALMTEETDLFDATMRGISIDPQEVRVGVEKRLEISYRHTGKNLRIAPETTGIFKYSMDKARSENRRTIKASDMCFVFATDKSYMLTNILQNPEGQDSIFGRNR